VASNRGFVFRGAVLKTFSGRGGDLPTSPRLASLTHQSLSSEYCKKGVVQRPCQEVNLFFSMMPVGDEQQKGEVTPEPKPSPSAKGEMEEVVAGHFINYVARRVGANPSVMKAVWAAIVQEAPAYLLEEQRTIDMGFVDLAAVPYRENWKQIMHAKFPNLAPSLKKVPKELAEAYLFNVGWDAEMLNSELCEFHRNGAHLGWAIEAHEKRQWAQIVNGYESKQRAHLGAAAYAKRWIRLVRRAGTRILRYFVAYVAKTTLPCAAIRNGGNARGDYLVPYIPKGKVRATAPQGFVVHCVNDPKPGEIKSPEVASLQGPFEEVPPVPLIPQSVKDVWKRGDNDKKK